MQQVQKMKEQLNDLSTLLTKAENAMDNGSFKLGAAMRMKATKIITEISANKDRVSQSINHFSPN